METVQDNPALNKVFGLFQDFQKSGLYSRLLLETRGGEFTAHLSLQCSPHWSPWMERTRPTETKKPRRTTPSRRRRNKARREKWLASKQAKNEDNIVEDNVNQDTPILEKDKDSIVIDKSAVSVDSASKDLKVLPEGKSKKLVQTVNTSAANKIQKLGVIDQIDGQIEAPKSLVTFDLSISAVDVDDAFCSIEENLCHGDDQLTKVPFISETASCEVREDNSDNSIFTMEVQVVNDKHFLEKVNERFKNWDPLWYGKPCGCLLYTSPSPRDS